MLRFLRWLIRWTAKNHGVTDGSSPKSPLTPERKAETLPSLAAPSGQKFYMGRTSTVQTSREQRTAMIAQLRLHEGERLFPYKCTAGRLTIGVGRNLDDRGITAEESAYLLGNDIDDYWERLETELPWILDLDPVRQRVLLDMAFNLGIGGLLGFRMTLAAIRGKEYERAAAMMLQSRWATQVGERAKRLSRMMFTGEIPKELRE